jgi:hypothetical protein
VDDLHDVARAATKRANHVDTRVAHLAAEDANNKSAKEALAVGKRGLAERHQARAKAHAARATELEGSSSSTDSSAASSSDSSSTAGGPPAPDAPEAGITDGLTTWMKNPRG